MKVFRVKQYIRLANGIGDWYVLATEIHLPIAIEYAERIVNNGDADREDIAIVRESSEIVPW